MTSTNAKLKRQIMKRVYYAYVFSLITNRAFWQGMALVIATSLLSIYVSFANVIENFLRLEVRRVPTFIYQAIITTEYVTLFLLAIIAFLFIGAIKSIKLSHSNNGNPVYFRN